MIYHKDRSILNILFSAEEQKRRIHEGLPLFIVLAAQPATLFNQAEQTYISLAMRLCAHVI